MDDFHLFGPSQVLGLLFDTLSAIFLDRLGLKSNLTRCSPNVLQASTIIDPKPALHQIYEQCPRLRVYQITNGFVVGTPAGHPLLFEIS